MQWKIPFKEYWKSEESKIQEISSQYEPQVNQFVVRSDETTTGKLSKEQMAVITRFPTYLDTIDKNWLKRKELVKSWKDKMEIWSMAYSIELFGSLNGLSAFYLCHRFRKAFGLADGRTAILNSYVPTVCVSAFFGSAIHYNLITAPLMTGIEDCQLCRRVKAGVIQGLTSTLYPIVYSSVSSIYFADYFCTYPTPQTINDQISRNYLYQIWWKAVKNNKTGLIAVAIFNFMFAFYMTQKEQQTIDFMYLSLLKQEFMKSKQKFS